jgi:hypothetical protein
MYVLNTKMYVQVLDRYVHIMYNDGKSTAIFVYEMPRRKVGHDSLTVQVPENLANIVRRLAKEEGRHLSKMVEILIRDGLNMREQQVAQGKLFDSVNSIHKENR